MRDLSYSHAQDLVLSHCQQKLTKKNGLVVFGSTRAKHGEMINRGMLDSETSNHNEWIERWNRQPSLPQEFHTGITHSELYSSYAQYIEEIYGNFMKFLYTLTICHCCEEILCFHGRLFSNCRSITRGNLWDRQISNEPWFVSCPNVNLQNKRKERGGLLIHTTANPSSATAMAAAVAYMGREKTVFVPLWYALDWLAAEESF